MTLTDRERLALNLRIAREAKGITQEAAAAAVGKTRGTIVNWENPKATPEPSSDEVTLLGRLYGVATRELRFGELERGPAVPRRLSEAELDRAEAIVARDEAARARPAKKGQAKGGRGRA